MVIGFTWSRLRSIGSMRFPDDGQEKLFVHTAGGDGFLLMRSVKLTIFSSYSTGAPTSSALRHEHLERHFPRSSSGLRQQSRAAGTLKERGAERGADAYQEGLCPAGCIA